MKIKVELGGGIEFLFDKKKELEITLENKNESKIKDIINEIVKLIKNKEELFINKETNKM